MKKIININLSGRVIPIEDAAYDNLQRYIESLRRYFAAEEGRDEIINDIESRIAELMNDKIKKGAASISERDVAEIMATMGRVEDFEAANGESEPASSATMGNTGNQSYSGSSRRNYSGRLYRDADDKFIGGVCAGIAAYINVDPTIVRLVFAIITFGGFGFGFLLYILLWILLPAHSLPNRSGKRFFRNPDDRIFGGVAGGLGAYFNIKPWTIRIIFAAPLLLNIFFGILHGAFFYNHNFFPNFFIGSFTSTFILIYIILWIVLPEAKSPYEKMEMRGERIDVNRIKQNVQEGMGDFKDRMTAWGEEVKTSAQAMSARAKEFTRSQGADFASDFGRTVRPVGSGIGHAIGVVFKSFFLFVAGIIAFLLFVILLVFTFGGLAQPVNAFLIDGFWQKLFMWSTIVLFFAVPLIGLIVWIIRRMMNVRSQNRYLGWTFGGLWTLGWFALILFVSSMVKDFRSEESISTTVPVSKPYMRKLVVQVPEPAVRYSGSFSWVDINEDAGWDVSEDSLRLSNIRLSIKPGKDSQYQVTVYKISKGDNYKTARQRADRIQYSVLSQDSLLILPSGFGFGPKEKYRDQKVLVEITVPVGKQIRFDHSVGEKLNPYDIRISDNEWHIRRRGWNRRNLDSEWDNNWYQDWLPDTDYYMTADGKLKEVGSPDTGSSATPEGKSDSTKARQTQRLQRKANDDAEDDTTQDDQTTQRKSIGGDVSTPAAMPFVPTIF